MTAETMMGNGGQNEPKSEQHAMKMEDKAKWVEAMIDEIYSLADNHEFEVVDQTISRKIVTCKWVYALKKNSKGNVIRHKARLAARGYSQVVGIDYGEVFEPVVRWDDIRFLLAHVARTNMESKQVDVETAFLHGAIEEDICIQLPSLPNEFVAKFR